MAGAIRTERIDLKVTPEEKELLQACSYVYRNTLSEFIRNTSVALAKSVLYSRLSEDLTGKSPVLAEYNKADWEKVYSEEGIYFVLKLWHEWKEKYQEKEMLEIFGELRKPT